MRNGIVFASYKETVAMSQESFGEVCNDFKEKTVLCVDDNGLNQVVIEKILQTIGIKTVAVKNGASAVRKLMEGFRPDVILMDLQMPVMGGVEACELIRKWYGTSIPIIINSGCVDEADKEKLTQLGIEDFLEKPYNQSDIFGKLKKNIPQLPA